MPPKRPLSRKRQTKLNFSPASHASPKPKPKPTFTVDSSSDSGLSPSRLAKRQRVEQETKRGMKQGMPLTPNKRGMFGSSDNEIIISSGSSSETSEDNGKKPAGVAPKKRGKQAKAVVDEDLKEDEIKPSRKKGKQRKETTSHDSSESESVGQVEVVERTPKRKRTKPAKEAGQEESHSKHKAGRSAKRTSTRTEKLPEPESEDEESTIHDGSRKKAAAKAKGKKAAESKQGPVDPSDEDSEDEVAIAPRSRTQKRRARSESSEEEEPVQTKQPSKRKKRRASTPEDDSDAEDQEPESNDEADELKEELAFLQSSPPGFGKTQTKAKTAREKALEAMKKRRAANTAPSPSAAARRKPVVVDSESESDLEIIPEERGESSEQDDESEESDAEEHVDTAQDVLYGEDEEDEDFINDDDAPIGVPSEVALPLEFSKMRNAKPRELFKYAIEWMVQKKINPAFSSDDEIYIMTFRKLDDEVNGLASSKYHSSAWTKDFTRAIRARPEMVVSDIDPRTRAIMEPHCEACNRKTHTASYEMSFTGKPYHKETLEPLAANASDSDSDADSDSSDISSTNSEEALNGEKPTYDDRGERIPPESKVFSLGSTCKANAQVAHTLYHWRYHLNSWVMDYLVRRGHCTAEKLVARDKWSVRKREKFANKVVDEMEKDGEIKKLHKLYKDQVNYALETDNAYGKGWGRRA